MKRQLEIEQESFMEQSKKQEETQKAQVAQMQAQEKAQEKMREAEEVQKTRSAEEAQKSMQAMTERLMRREARQAEARQFGEMRHLPAEPVRLPARVRAPSSPSVSVCSTVIACSTPTVQPGADPDADLWTTPPLNIEDAPLMSTPSLRKLPKRRPALAPPSPPRPCTQRLPSLDLSMGQMATKRIPEATQPWAARRRDQTQLRDGRRVRTVRGSQT